MPRRARRLLAAWLAIMATMGAAGAGRFASATGSERRAGTPEAGASLSDTLTGEAKRHYDAARIFVGDRNFERARASFEAAYAVAHDIRLLWNIAACEKDLTHYARAVHLLDQYLKDGATSLSDAERQSARDVIAALEPVVARMQIRVITPGADVAVNDRVIGASPFDEVVVLDVGDNEVVARWSPFLATTRRVTMSSGGPVSVLELARPMSGRLRVACCAKGATLSIDGMQVGAPLDTRLSPGLHRVHVNGSASLVDRTLEIANAELADLSTGYLSIGYPEAMTKLLDGADVLIDGHAAAHGAEEIELWVGEHTVRVQMNAMTTRAGTVVLRAGEHKRVALFDLH